MRGRMRTGRKPGNKDVGNEGEYSAAATRLGASGSATVVARWYGKENWRCCVNAEDLRYYGPAPGSLGNSLPRAARYRAGLFGAPAASAGRHLHVVTDAVVG